MMKEPKRHHYIPQFILRNFAFDDSDGIHFCNIETKEMIDLKTSDVFMQRNLYRDEINHALMPTKLESDFAKFEQEASKIVKKCLCDDLISLTAEEYDSLLVFLALMGIRSANAFNKSFDKVEDDGFYSLWQEDGNLSDFWKRNLEFMVKCRSINEVINHPNIDEPIKVFFMRDSFGYFGKYIAVMEKRGPLDFVISDAYPVAVTGDIMNMPMFDYYPISPKRIIVLCSNGVDNVMPSVRMFEKSNLRKPHRSIDGKQIEIKVTKIYENMVAEINSDIIKNSKSGYILTEQNLDNYKSGPAN